MRIFGFLSKIHWHQDIHTCALASAWTAGLITGFLICGREVQLASLMAIAAKSDVSIVGMLLVPVLPLLISFAALWCAKPAMIYFAVFLLAISFGIDLSAIGQAFGSAAWLIRSLLLFTRSAFVVIALWLLLPFCQRSRKVILRDAAIALGISLAVSITDALLIAPFLPQVMP